MNSVKSIAACVAVMLAGGSLAAAEAGAAGPAIEDVAAAGARLDKPIELVVVTAARSGAAEVSRGVDEPVRIESALEPPRVDLAVLEIEAAMPTLSL